MPVMPPQHSLHAQPCYIHPTDPAWSNWMDEVNAMSVEQAAEHPMVKYFYGRSRYDLDAPGLVYGETRTARSYLDGTPIVWRLRRLKIRQLAACQQRPENDGALDAVRLGLDSIDGHTEPLKRVGGLLHEDELDGLAQRYGARVVFDVGMAVIHASGEPTPGESMRSGS